MRSRVARHRGSVSVKADPSRPSSRLEAPFGALQYALHIQDSAGKRYQVLAEAAGIWPAQQEHSVRRRA